MEIKDIVVPKFSFSLPMTRLVHENFSIIMAFAFSRKQLQNFSERFSGEWKYLRRALFEVATERVEKACLELALFLRLIDDEQDISGYYRKTGRRPFGRLYCRGGEVRELWLRDVCNKIIHAKGLKWDIPEDGDPVLICLSQDDDKWERAEVNIFELAALCGGLMS